jgi:hypothetical protein
MASQMKAWFMEVLCFGFIQVVGRAVQLCAAPTHWVAIMIQGCQATGQP